MHLVPSNIVAGRNKDKYKDLPEELQAQWELDREKKAENKRMRALQRIEAAADPLSEKKGGKKGMKAMLAAARYDGPEELPNRITDLPSLVQQIRRFLANVGGPSSMSLPPLNKATRKRVHELAGAFNLNSKSKGGGDTRYTTLTKTTKSGFKINERKIGRIMREAGHQWEESSRYDKGNGKNMSLAKHREGEEVGKVRPHKSTSRSAVMDHIDMTLHRLLQKLASRISVSRCSPLWDGQRAIGLVCRAVWTSRS